MILVSISCTGCYQPFHGTARRIESPNVLYHVMSRGNGGQDIYLSDQDRHLFLSLLEEVSERFNIDIQETNGTPFLFFLHSFSRLPVLPASVEFYALNKPPSANVAIMQVSPTASTNRNAG